MSRPDWDDPETAGAWLAGQRAVAEQYLRGQQALVGAIEAAPAWSLVPYVVFWRALGDRTGEPVYWVITGDLPTDFIPCDAAATPRAAAEAFAERWRVVAAYLAEAGSIRRFGSARPGIARASPPCCAAGPTFLPSGRPTTTTGDAGAHRGATIRQPSPGSPHARRHSPLRPAEHLQVRGRPRVGT